MLMDALVAFWQLTDPGISAGGRLDAEVIEWASELQQKVQANSLAAFPGATEPKFWNQYIGWADYFLPFELAECRAMLAAGDAGNLPALYLFSVTKGAEAVEEAFALRAACAEKRTARERYVHSVLDSGFGTRDEVMRKR